jgi:hypothetical protein
MKEDAYWYISMAYASIAGLSSLTLITKAYLGYKRYKYLEKEDKHSYYRPLQYILDTLHIPPYVIASYWYYDAYKSYHENI